VNPTIPNRMIIRFITVANTGRLNDSSDIFMLIETL
jgi:hypothetical protein